MNLSRLSFETQTKMFFQMIALFSMIGSISSTITYFFLNYTFEYFIINALWFVLSIISLLLIKLNKTKVGILMLIFFIQLMRVSNLIVSRFYSNEINIFSISINVGLFLFFIVIIGYLINIKLAFIYSGVSIIHFLITAILFDNFLILHAIGLNITLLITVVTVFYLSHTQSKLLEAKIISENKYQSLFKNLYEGYIYCKVIYNNDNEPVDYLFIEANETFENTIKIKKENIINKKLSEVIISDRKTNEKLLELFNKSIKNNKKITNKLYFDYPVNKWFTLNIYIPQRNYIVALFQDTTEQINMEKQLKQIEFNFNQLLECSQDFIYRINVKDNLSYDYFSNNTEKIFGYKKEDIIKQILDENKIHPNDKVNFKTHFEKLLSTNRNNKTKNQIEFRLKNKNNDCIWLSDYNIVIKDKKNNPEYIIGSIRNITKQKKQQKQIEKERNLYKNIFDNIPIGIICVIHKDYSVITNSNVSNFLGYTKEEIEKRNFFELAKLITYPEDLEKEQKQINKIIKEKIENYEFEKRYLTKNGNTNWGHIKTYTQYDKEGKVKLSVSTIQDITEAKEAKTQLEEVMTDLRNSNQELKLFSAVIAHDLKSPLSAIISALKLIKRKINQKEYESILEFSTISIEKVENMAKMIDSLMKYSELRKEQIETGYNDINIIVKRALENIELEIIETKAQIEYEKLPKIYCDESLMVSLFQNLITNAIKYSSDTPKITITFEEKENEWLFSVKDNGVGIHSYNKEMIFTIFKRAYNEKQQDISGIGVGLAFCKKIVDKHQGKIWVESQLDKGSTFYFTISKSIK